VPITVDHLVAPSF